MGIGLRLFLSYVSTQKLVRNNASCKLIGIGSIQIKMHDGICRNLPFGGRATPGLTGASSKKGKRAESPPTFIRGKRRKNRKRRGLRTLSVKGSGVVFTHGEGIITPRVCHKGRQPLIECANMTSICFIFPFLRFLCLLMPFVFFPLLLRISQWG